jgi:hypothetical protein
MELGLGVETAVIELAEAAVMAAVIEAGEASATGDAAM